MKEDYKKAVYYRKLSQRSTKPWRKNLSNSPKGERQSTLSQRKSQSPKRSEEESKAVTKKSQAPANEQDTKKENKDGERKERRRGEGKGKGDRGGKGAFHGALCDDFLEDSDLE
eukprot:TRINITY_DN5956_c0_g1_i10.p2 TRINITY_DN5956_c0_g1~~TRINITY_DN5956_c0_g1_i10.p2  ORF type:complete len:114 (+),score=37.95 TRINITY_DN5956_c0_g1_i10:685-1026(+)